MNKYEEVLENYIPTKNWSYEKFEQLVEMCKANVTTSKMAECFGVSQRAIQLKLKQNGINRTLKKSAKLRKKTTMKQNEKVEEIKERLKNIKKEECFWKPIEKEVNRIADENKWLYAFCKNDEVLYIGKCVRREGNEKYVGKYDLSTRMYMHFANPDKHLPKELYKNVDTIFYKEVFGNVEKAELDAILTYKYRKQCFYNKKFDFNANIREELNVFEWRVYNTR